MIQRKLLYVLVFILLVSSASALLTDDLLAYYSMETSTSSNMVDSTTDSARNLSGINTPDLSTDDALLGSKAFHKEPYKYYNRSGTYYDFQDHTFSFWMRVNSTFNYSVQIMDKDTYGSSWNDWSFSAWDHKIQWYVCCGTNDNLISDGNFTTGYENVWRHFVLVRNGSTRRIFIDGVLNVTKDSGTCTVDGTSHFEMGKYYGGTQGDYFIDEIAIYTRNLSAHEISLLYNGGNGYNPLTGGVLVDFFSQTPANDTGISDNTTVYFNLYGVNATSGGNCTLYVNDLDKANLTDIFDGVRNFTYNVTMGNEGSNELNITCLNNGPEAGSDDDIKYLFVDTNIPTFTYVNMINDSDGATFELNGSYLIEDPLHFNISLLDDNLYSFNFSVCKQADSSLCPYTDYVVSIDGTSYNYTNSTGKGNFTGSGGGNYTFKMEVCDSHTLSAIPELASHESDSGGVIGAFNITIDTDDYSSFVINKHRDKYTFDIHFSSDKSTIVVNLMSDQKINQISTALLAPSAQYMGHFVSGKQWIDFTNSSIEIDSVQKMSDQHYKLTMSTIGGGKGKSVWTFDSTGLINCINRTDIAHVYIDPPLKTHVWWWKNQTSGVLTKQADLNTENRFYVYGNIQSQNNLTYGSRLCDNAGNCLNTTDLFDNTSKVPYSGATQNTDTGNYNLSASWLKADYLNVTSSSYLGDLILESENITVDNIKSLTGDDVTLRTHLNVTGNLSVTGDINVTGNNSCIGQFCTRLYLTYPELYSTKADDGAYWYSTMFIRGNTGDDDATLYIGDSTASSYGYLEWDNSETEFLIKTTVGEDVVVDAGATGQLYVRDNADFDQPVYMHDGLLVNGSYDTDETMALHVPSENFWAYCLYNDAFSTTNKLFCYYAYNNGVFAQGTESNTNLTFYTNTYNNERMTIENTGNVLVHTPGNFTAENNLYVKNNLNVSNNITADLGTFTTLNTTGESHFYNITVEQDVFLSDDSIIYLRDDVNISSAATTLNLDAAIIYLNAIVMALGDGTNSNIGLSYNTDGQDGIFGMDGDNNYFYSQDHILLQNKKALLLSNDADEVDVNISSQAADEMRLTAPSLIELKSPKSTTDNLTVLGGLNVTGNIISYDSIGVNVNATDLDSSIIFGGIRESGAAVIETRAYTTTAAQTGRLFLSRGRGSHASPAAVEKGDRVGTILSRSYNGTGWTNPAAFNWKVDDTVDTDTGAVPTGVSFMVGNSTSNRFDAFTISSKGNVNMTKNLTVYDYYCDKNDYCINDFSSFLTSIGGNPAGQIVINNSMLFWAERGSIVSGQCWSWGNGQTQDRALIVPYDGMLTSYAIQTDGTPSTSLDVDLYLNGAVVAELYMPKTLNMVNRTNLSISVSKDDLIGVCAGTESGTWVDGFAMITFVSNETYSFDVNMNGTDVNLSNLYSANITFTNQICDNGGDCLDDLGDLSAGINGTNLNVSQIIVDELAYFNENVTFINESWGIIRNNTNDVIMGYLDGI